MNLIKEQITTVSVKYCS